MTKRFKLKKKLRGLIHRRPPRPQSPPTQRSPKEAATHTVSAEKPLPNDHEQCSELNDKPFSLWERAERALNADPDKKRLLQSAHEILGSELGSELLPIGAAGRQQQLSELFERKTSQLEKEKWKIQFGDHEVVVQEFASKVFDGVLRVQEIFNLAASASPPVSIACAGLSVVFGLALKATQQEAILLETLDYNAGLISRFKVMEDLCRSDSAAQSPHHSELVSKFEDHLTVLYTAILELQFRALCYLRRSIAIKLLGDAFDYEGWAGTLDGIRELESSAEKDAQTIGAANVDGKLNEILDAQKYNQARQNMLERDEAAQKVMQTLRENTCPYKARKDRNSDRVPGTCEWFTNHRQFQHWHGSQGSSLLWVSADPGCGKSVLAKYLIDELLPATKESTICYFFFKDDYPDQRTATGAVCALLHHIFLSQPHLLRDSILQTLNNTGRDLTESFSDLWSIFTKIVADPSAGTIICVLDALDECQDDGRAHLIKAVTRFQMGGSQNGNVKFLVTSRPYDHIHQEFRGVQEDLSTIHLSGEGEEEVEQISKEIQLVVRKRVEDIGRRRALKAEQCKLLLDELLPIPNQTYLWVNLTMDVISRTPGFTRGNIRDAIKHIPTTVNDAYEKILNRSSAPERARTILSALVAAARPLSVGEMSIVMAFYQARQSSAEIEDYLESEEDFRKTLRDVCGLFVTVIHSQVYLLHQTAREFLVKAESDVPVDKTSPATTWKGSISREDSNRTLAEVCTWYLASGQSKPLKTFSEYSSRNWLTHFKGCNIKADDPITECASCLCGPDRNDSSWDTPLMFAYTSGLTPVVEYLIKVHKRGLDSRSPTGRTPLAYAAQNGDVDAVRMILDHVVKTASKNVDCAAPLWLAVVRGHTNVIQLFLDYGVDISLTNRAGQSPISLAAKLGDVRVMEILITHGADLNTRDICGNTPLSIASGPVRKLLLDNGAHAD
jgi:ankyrin repeat protein